ncbi:MAG: BamA/TamA family outer membrane protein [Flavihumibacter sp.]
MRKLLSIMIIAGLYACSSTRTVPAGDQLYTGATVKWNGKKPKDYSALEAGMTEKISPRPNRKFLGMPIKLWLYNIAKEPKGKGLNYLLREKWGEKPVLYSRVKQELTNELLERYTEDNGYFQSVSKWEKTTQSAKKAGVRYSITPGTRYTYREIRFETDSTDIGQTVASTRRRSLLKKGDSYSLDMIKQERDRIHNRLKERGYYYFTPDYLIFQVDTNHQGQAAIFLNIKKETPSEAKIAYRMQNVIIYPGYTIDNDSMMRRAPERDMGSYKVVDPKNLFRSNVFDRSVFLREDSIYRLTAHDITLQRLMNLGTFRFIRGQFTVGLDSSKLNARFFLTSMPKRSLQFEVTGNSRSNNFVGTVAKVTAVNRNWLGYANRLEVNLSGGYEWQVGGKTTTQNTNGYTLNAEVALSMPQFYVPGFSINPKTPYVPRTKIGVGYEMLSRPGLYTLSSFKFQYGYAWRQSRFVDHAFNPIAISYVLPGKISSEFQAQLDQDPAMRQSMEKQFIVGSNYTYTFNNQVRNRKNSFFVTLNADAAGNLLGLLTGKRDTSGKQLFGQPFAQYVRLYADGRYYNKLSDRLTWANRLFLGYGYPYGNSKSLPFVKQFFIGGSNSLRAFRARTLGPGTFYKTDSTNNYLIANEAGDIKLEFNTELRLKLFSILQAAAFVDAGNIWLQSKNTDKPGANFNINTVLTETAVGAGLGLRADASILIIRFDLALPLRKPWLTGDKWVIKDIDLGSKTWRQENLVLNIAIGFPF